MTNILLDRPLATAGIGSYLPLLGRLFIAAIFLMSGLFKAIDPGGTIGYISSVGLPLPELAYVGAVAIEVIGGAFLVIGYRTRLTAAALAVFTVAAGFLFHFDFADQNQFIHFFKNLAMTGGLLQLIAFGSGSLSVDSRR